MNDVRTVRLAMAQMAIEWGERHRNLAHATELIAQAAAEGCEIVLLPECLDIGWTHPDTSTLAEPVPGPSSDVLAEAAGRHGVWVVAGLSERDGDLNYNAAVLRLKLAVPLYHRQFIGGKVELPTLSPSGEADSGQVIVQRNRAKRQLRRVCILAGCFG